MIQPLGAGYVVQSKGEITTIKRWAYCDRCWVRTNQIKNNDLWQCEGCKHEHKSKNNGQGDALV